ncbi:MAG: flagellar basal body-associated protein FliL [Magnetospirillum sp.]|nr:flagellar basal body-associated protein FliL [Magnetospirillum sp.]
MVRLVFIMVAFLLMAGAAIGGLYYWGIDPLAKLGFPSLAKAPAASAPAVPQPPAFVDFGLLSVPVIEDREVRCQAQFIIRLEVAPGMKEKVADELPRLQADYLEDLIGFMPLAVHDDMDIDEDAVRRRLFAVSRQVLGDGVIKAVVIEHSALQ